MKRFLAFLIIVVLLSGEAALADGKSIPLGQVAQGGAQLWALIRDTGEASADPRHERVLEATVTAGDGSLSQVFRYNASVSPGYEQAAGYALLDDLNFDGYRDLCLLTAQGARNVFHVFALWNQESGCFDPIMQGCPWLPSQNGFAQEPSPLELCCYQLLPEAGRIVSEVADGYRYRTLTVYEWEGGRVSEKGVASVWDAGEGRIGERLEMLGTQISFCWLESYPESWYYGQEGVAQERLESLKAVMLGGALTDPAFLRVRDGAWVNLRLQDSKDSPSLARLNAGAEVQVLQAACGSENGWVRVWTWPQEPGVQPLGDYDPNTGLTGYVWHSFLEAAP